MLTSIRFAVVGAVFALATASTLARAEESSQNLGPVGPYHTIRTTVGSKSVLAFYEPNSGHCDFHAVVWNTTDVNVNLEMRFGADLNPLQVVHIGTAENSLKLQCGDNAKSLAIVDTDKGHP